MRPHKSRVVWEDHFLWLGSYSSFDSVQDTVSFLGYKLTSLAHNKLFIQQYFQAFLHRTAIYLYPSPIYTHLYPSPRFHSCLELPQPRYTVFYHVACWTSWAHLSSPSRSLWHQLPPTHQPRHSTWHRWQGCWRHSQTPCLCHQQNSPSTITNLNEMSVITSLHLDIERGL